MFSSLGSPVAALLSPAARAGSSPFERLQLESRPATAHAVALCFEGLLGPVPPSSPATGLENILLNDIMVSHQWASESAWPWRDRSHINVLEGRAFLRALRLRALGCDEQRFVHAVDSSVVLGAALKGRTSSRLLRPIVMKAAALQVGFGLYPALLFCPTRLNTSDCPTRDHPLPSPVSGCLATAFQEQDLYSLSCLGGLTRSSANWLRLGLLLACSSPGSDGTPFLKALTLKFRDTKPPQSSEAARQPPVRQKGFDSTLGFPGEGPQTSVSEAPQLEPRNPRDRARAKARAGVALAQGRPVLERTTKNRAFLLSLFGDWLRSCGLDLEDLLDSNKATAETVNDWVVCYGRLLFESGRPYWPFRAHQRHHGEEADPQEGHAGLLGSGLLLDGP